MSDDSPEKMPARITETLMQVFNQIALHRRAVYKLAGAQTLTMLEAEICLLIGKKSGIIGSEIADTLKVTRSAASQFISKLKAKGLVTIEPDPENARLKRIYLTDMGQEAAAASKRYGDLMSEALYDVTEEELSHYLDFVTKLQRFHARAISELSD